MATAFKPAAALPFVDPVDMPDLYAITAKGRCMEPLYVDGVVLVGDKREAPEPGDVVIVHFDRDIAPLYGMPGWVKRLVGEAFGLVIVEQLSPPRRYNVPVEHIAAMHKCVGTAISKGDGTALYRFPKAEALP